MSVSMVDAILMMDWSSIGSSSSSLFQSLWMIAFGVFGIAVVKVVVEKI